MLRVLAPEEGGYGDAGLCRLLRASRLLINGVTQLLAKPQVGFSSGTVPTLESPVAVLAPHSAPEHWRDNGVPGCAPNESRRVHAASYERHATA